MADTEYVTRDEFRAEMAGFRAEWAEFRADMRTEFASMRQDLAGMRVELAQIRVEMSSSLPRWAFFGGLAGGLVAAAFRLLG